MDPKTLHPFRTLYGSLKGALMVPFKGTLRVPYFRKRLCIKSQAAGGSIDSFFPALFAKLCQGKDLAARL